MDWTTILTAILTFVGGGGLGALIMFPQKKRAAELENETRSSEQWKELYERSENTKAAQSELIDRLRDENNRITTENAVLKIFKCKTVKCVDRDPPLGTNEKE